jgi:LysM repeat protein
VTSHKVRNGESLSKIAFNYEVTWEFLCRINGISDPRRIRADQTLKVVQGPFSAIVNRHDFTIDVWLGQPMGKGSLFVASYRVGLGKENSTPAGTWMVRTGGKLKNPKFWGASGLKPIEADDPANPLGEFWIGLEGVAGAAVGQESYGIHGTIEPDSIGKTASLGCIRLLNEDVAVLYEMLVEGQSIVQITD